MRLSIVIGTVGLVLALGCEPTPPTQTTFPEKQFNPNEYSVECVDPILGSEITDEIIYKGRTPTTADLDKIAHCYVGIGLKQPQDLGEGREPDQSRGQSQDLGEGR